MAVEAIRESGEEREATLLKIGLVQLIMAALLAFSLVNRHHHLTFLLLILLVFAYGARFWSRLSLKNLDFFWDCENFRIFPGETVQLTVRADNRKVLPVWLRVVVSVPSDLGDAAGRDVPVREQGLLWYQSVAFDWRLTPNRRGIYRIGPPQVTAGDLLGLYPRGRAGQETPCELIVFPRLVPLKPFAHIRRDLFGSPGAKSPVVDPIYLLGTRDYQAGRPSRYIHWTASARLNRLQERVFEPSRQARVLVVLDVAPFAAHNDTDRFEETVEVVASLAVECDRAGFAVGLVTNGVMAGDRSPLVSVARSGGQAGRILETLAGVSMQPGPPIGENLLKMEAMDGGLSCVVFTLGEDDGPAGAAAVLRRKNILATRVCCDRTDLPGRSGWEKITLDGLLAVKEHRI